MTLSRRILIIQGHPDSSERHFCHALADRYRAGAASASHELRMLEIAQLDFPFLRSKQEWEQGQLPPSLREAQASIAWAEHLVLIFPLWLGDMPALLKAFLEQVARPGFALGQPDKGGLGKKLLGGRSARVVVTMGMPALVYRLYFQAHSVRSLERNILGFVGIAPVRRTLIGMVEGAAAARAQALEKLRLLGERAE